MKITKKACLIILAVVCILVGMVNIVMAFTGPGGRDHNRGYFFNSGPFVEYPDGTNVEYEHVITEIKDITGITNNTTEGISGYTDSKESFIAGIKSSLNNGSDRNKTGAAFIIQTMRESISHGKPVPGTTDGDADIANWESRILDDRVKMDVEDYSYSWNSGYVASANGIVANDVAYLWMPGSASSLVFKVDDEIKFAIKIDCGNPVGGLPGVPSRNDQPKSWSIEPQVFANYDKALPGTTITWKYTVKNKGPDSTDKDVTYNYTSSGYLPDSGDDRIAWAGLASGETNSFNSTTTVPDNATSGERICRTVSATPGGSDNSSTVTSPEACVDVITETPAPDPPDTTGSSAGCAPMNVNISSVRNYINNNSPYNFSLSPYDQLAGPLDINISIAGASLSSTNAPVKNYHYTNPPYSSFDVTNNFTTGDRYKVSFSSAQYIYGYSTKASYIQKSIPVDGGGTTTINVFDHWEYRPKKTSVNSTSYIGPCYNYNLEPSVSNSITSTGVAEAGQTINVKSNVQNSDPDLDLPLHDEYPSVGATKSVNTEWVLTQLAFKPGNTAPYTNNGDGGYTDGYISYGNLCNKYDYFISAGSGNCSVSSHNTNNSYPVGPTTIFTSVDVGDYAAGTELCYVESLRDYSSGNSFWRHSAPSCVTIGKKPKVQVWGGDLSVGRTFGSLGRSNSSVVQTSTSIKSLRVFGSWIEYGIFSPNKIIGAASGSAFAVAGGQLTSNLNKCSALSFVNLGNLGNCMTGNNIGGYVSSTSIPDVDASFSGNSTVPTSSGPYGPQVRASELVSGIYTYDGDLYLLDSTLKPGQSVILKVNGDLKVLENQNYNVDNNGLKYTNVSQLPQLIIIANNINIAAAVSNVDAWLITKGNLNTCSAVPNDGTGLYVDECSQKLVVNGPIMANKLYLNRTAGSGVGSESGDPAEIFNLRADAYLWAYNRASGNGHMQTVYSTELPVRL